MKTVAAFASLLALLISPLCSDAVDEYQYMDKLALEAGADKASSYHNYTEVYSAYFAPFKESPIKFLEIGIWKGYSVRFWENYFKNADLHFMDITFDRVEYHSTRSHYYLADQANPFDLAKFVEASGGNFDVILDDGGHTNTQQITSFCCLFPHLKSGGLYIIEDLHTSYWGNYGGDYSPTTAITFLKGLVDDVNFIGATTAKASHLNIDPGLLAQMSIYQKEIYSIHFYDSIAIIKKR